MAAYHDWGTHYLGWAFYKSEPWSFPIGQIQNYHYPSGSNIGFTDSIPLLAIPLKIFADIFNEDFQYFGIFLLSSHFLMAFFSFKLFTFYRLPKLAAIFGSILLAFNPVILYRAMHPALTAQWLIIASLYLYAISSSTKNVKRIVFIQLILLLISSLITPYLFAIVFGFSIVLLVKLLWIDKTISISSAFFNFCLTVFLPLLLWYIVGMISFNEETSFSVSNSYGLYAWNLNGFVNSKGYSSFLKELPHFNIHQYEGYSYLGLGIIILIIINIGFLFIKRALNSFTNILNKNNYPLLVYIVFLTAFAITPKISLGSTLLFDLPTPAVINQLGEVFRASGRFIWIFYYCIFIFSILLFFKFKLGIRIKMLIVILIVAIQFYDTKHFFSRYNFDFGTFKVEKLSKDKWNKILPYFKSVITYPPFNNSLAYKSDYQDICYLAMKNNLSITMGYVARKPVLSDKKFRDSLKTSIVKGDVFDSTLYITTAKDILDLENIIQKEGIVIGMLDGYFLLYPKKLINECLFLELKKSSKLIESLSSIYYVSQGEETFLPKLSLKRLKYNIESLNQIDNLIKFKGWAFREGVIDSSDDSLSLILFNSEKAYEFSLKVDLRNDVTKHFKAKDLSQSGFNTIINTQTINKGLYKVALKIKEDDGSEEVIVLERMEEIKIK